MQGNALEPFVRKGAVRLRPPSKRTQLPPFPQHAPAGPPGCPAGGSPAACRGRSRAPRRAGRGRTWAPPPGGTCSRGRPAGVRGWPRARGSRPAPAPCPLVAQRRRSLLAGLADRWRVQEGQALLRVLQQHAVEEARVVAPAGHGEGAAPGGESANLTGGEPEGLERGGGDAADVQVRLPRSQGGRGACSALTGPGAGRGSGPGRWAGGARRR